MSSVCAPGTRSQGESTHQLGKLQRWTCETPRQKTKAVCGILSGGVSRSGGKQSASNYTERDELMGFHI